MSYLDALRHAVSAVIDSDLNLTDTRAAVTSLIPKEFHVDHR